MARETKIHAIKNGVGISGHEILTHCGKVGYQCKGFGNEFDTPDCNRFVAGYAEHIKVDCKTCLRGVERERK